MSDAPKIVFNFDDLTKLLNEESEFWKRLIIQPLVDPPKSSTCPCGIYRGDCTYHK